MVVPASELEIFINIYNALCLLPSLICSFAQLALLSLEDFINIPWKFTDKTSDDDKPETAQNPTPSNSEETRDQLNSDNKVREKFPLKDWGTPQLTGGPSASGEATEHPEVPDMVPNYAPDYATLAGIDNNEIFTQKSG